MKARTSEDFEVTRQLTAVTTVEVIRCMCGYRRCANCGSSQAPHLQPPQFVRCPHCGIALGSCSLNPPEAG